MEPEALCFGVVRPHLCISACLHINVSVPRLSLYQLACHRLLVLFCTKLVSALLCHPLYLFFVALLIPLVIRPITFLKIVSLCRLNLHYFTEYIGGVVVVSLRGSISGCSDQYPMTVHRPDQCRKKRTSGSESCPEGE